MRSQIFFSGSRGSAWTGLEVGNKEVEILPGRQSSGLGPREHPLQVVELRGMRRGLQVFPRAPAVALMVPREQ